MEQTLNQEQKEVSDKLEQIINDGAKKLNDNPPTPEPTPEPEATAGIPPIAEVLLELPEKVLKDLMNGSFNTLALRLGDNWKLSADESEKLSHYLHIVLQKYKITLSPEVALLLWTSLIIGSRAMQTDWKKVFGKKVIDAEAQPKPKKDTKPEETQK